MNAPIHRAAETLLEYKQEHQVEQITKDGGHYYTAATNHAIYPSVTTIFGVLNKNLMGWHNKLTIQAYERRLAMMFANDQALNIPTLMMALGDALKESDRVRDVAATSGTYVHELIESYCNQQTGGTPNIPLYEDATPTQLDHYDHAVDFLQKHKIKPLAAEYMIYSPPAHNTGMIQKTPGYGGTVDLIAYNEAYKEYCIVDWKTGNTKQDTHLIQLAAYAHAVPLDIRHAYVFYTKHNTFNELVSEVSFAHVFEKFCKVAAAWDVVNSTADLFE